MEEYIRNWAKQEGFAVTKNSNGKTIYWRCIHAGKYRNRHDLPVEVTDRSKRQELLDADIINKESFKLMIREDSSSTTWSIYEARLSFLCGIY